MVEDDSVAVVSCVGRSGSEDELDMMVKMM